MTITYTYGEHRGEAESRREEKIERAMREMARGIREAFERPAWVPDVVLDGPSGLRRSLLTSWRSPSLTSSPKPIELELV